ncbi:MAG: hypothetical protein AAGC73_03365 [Verrucomicrobiota bacterium]
MTLSKTSSQEPQNSNLGLQLARWAGRILGLVLAVWAIRLFVAGPTSILETVQAGYFLAYGLVLNLPYSQLSDGLWKATYASVTVLSAGFVFLMIVVVMFAYMEAAERGERLGVPGLEGSLIFVALMQVPVLLFQRKPDLID